MPEHSNVSEKLPEIHEKLLLIVYPTSCDDHAVIFSPHFERQGGRLFVVGKAPSDVLPGFSGVTVALAWDQIQQYYIFDDVKHYERARSEYLASESEFTPRTFFSYFANWGKPSSKRT